MGANVSKRLESAHCSKHYASIAADKDMITECPLYANTDPGKAWLPRQIVIMGSGNLVYVEECDSGTTITYPVTAPYTLNLGGVRTLKAATTCTDILVEW